MNWSFVHHVVSANSAKRGRMCWWFTDVLLRVIYPSGERETIPQSVSKVTRASKNRIFGVARHLNHLFASRCCEVPGRNRGTGTRSVKVLANEQRYLTVYYDQ